MPHAITSQLLRDEDLLRMMKTGDRTAFDDIYDRYWQRLYSEAHKRLKNTQQIEELVQDVFADLWEKRESKDIVNLRSYLLTCTKYQVYAIYRKEKNNPEFEEPLEAMAFYNVHADTMLNEKELRGCVAIWLGMQPVKRAEIFRLKYMEDMGTRQISEILNISQKTVQNQLLNSYASLRKFLNKMMVALSIA